MSDENPYRYSVTMRWEDFQRMEARQRFEDHVRYIQIHIAADEWQSMVDRASGTHLKLIVDNSK